jgi:anti-sigma regulatory factor (Ser/Thr protein kinase)
MTAREVTRARHLIRACLDARGLSAARPTLELMADELVANAVRHGRGPIELHLHDDTTVRIEVYDHGGCWRPSAFARRRLRRFPVADSSLRGVVGQRPQNAHISRYRAPRSHHR